MTLKRLPYSFSVCKVESLSPEDTVKPFTFTAMTDEEASIVCITDNAPKNTLSRSDGWRALRIEGVLDFSLVGILAKITSILAENGIGIFALSTYNTDYVLVKEENYASALTVLEKSGYNII